MTPVLFYRTATGGEPVREWLKSMSAADRQTIGYDLMRVQHGWPVGMPLCRAMGDGLHEVRIDLSGNRIARVMICHRDGVLYALHGFIKKSRTTPEYDLKLARKRRQEIENGRQ